MSVHLPVSLSYLPSEPLIRPSHIPTDYFSLALTSANVAVQENPSSAHTLEAQRVLTLR